MGNNLKAMLLAFLSLAAGGLYLFFIAENESHSSKDILQVRVISLK